MITSCAVISHPDRKNPRRNDWNRFENGIIWEYIEHKAFFEQLYGGEVPSSGYYWKVFSYDPGVCRVKLGHDQDGVWPLRRDKAEIELKALRPGRTDVIFTCGSKRFTVHFTAQ